MTHDQRTATALGDRIAILRDGLVEQVGLPSAILNRPKTRFVARFTGSENIFETEVIHQNGGAVSLRIGEVILQTTVEAAIESDVTTCIHPSRVQLYTPDEVMGTYNGNMLSGTIHRCLNEGEEYRVMVTIDGAPITLTATAPSHSFEMLTVETGPGVRIAIPPDGIHLIQ